MRGRKLSYFIMVLTYVLIIANGILMVLPFAWMVVSSFKRSSEIYVFPPTFIPKRPTLEGYITVFQLVDVTRTFLNTFIYAAGVSLGSTFIASLAAFSFSFFKFKGQRLFFSLIISLMAVPFFVYVIPLYVMLVKLHLVNTYFGLILPGLASPFSIFMLTQYMRTMPSEYVDAAKLDGAPYRTIYFRVVLPYCKPVFIMLIVLTFLSAWTDFFWPLIILRTPDMQTLPVAIANLSGQYLHYWNVMMAFTTIAIIPVLIFFIVFRKIFLESAKVMGRLI